MLRKTPVLALLIILTVSGLLLSGAGTDEKNASTNTTVGAAALTAQTGGCAATLKNGNVLITGGHGANGTSNGAQVFNARNGAQSVASMLSPREGHACAALGDGRVLVAGGTTTGNGVTNSAEIFDPATGRWSNAGSMAVGRSGAAGIGISGGRILIAGGVSNGLVTNTLEIFDTATNSFRALPALLSSPRMQHAPVALQNGKILIAGGTNGSGSLDTVDLFDPTTNSVTPLGKKLSSPRAGLSATVLLNGSVFLAGGNDGKQDLNSAEIFNPKTNSSTPAAPMSTARNGHLAIRVPNNNTVLIVGGNAKGGLVLSQEIYVPWWNSYKAFGAPGLGSRALSESGTESTPRPQETLTNLAAESDTSVLPTLYTDQPDYAPGQTATITGYGWTPNSEITLFLSRDPHTAPDTTWTTTTDSGGSFSTTYQVVDADLGVTFTLTATSGSGDTAQIQTISFTDAAAVGSVSVGTQSGVLTFGTAGNATYSITVNRNGTGGGGFNANLCVTSSLPTGVTASFSPQPIAFGGGDNSKTSVLTLTSTAGTPAGSSSFTVRADSGTCTASSASFATGTLVVKNASSTTIQSFNPEPSLVGDSVTVTVKVDGSVGTPTGTVTITADAPGETCTTGSLNGGGVASCTLTFTSAGTRTVTATYSGDSNYHSSAGTKSHVANTSSADFTVTKTNNVGGSITYGNTWTWTLAVSNGGTGSGTFTSGQTILTDNLPNASVAYGSTTISGATGITGTGSISCGITSNNLSCIASGGTVIIAAAGGFSVQFTVTPSAATTFVNPRAGGVCAVDPNNAVAESNNGNNSCSNSVTVNTAALTITANSKTRVYGDANPTLDAGYASFVLSDSPVSLSGTLSCVTTATSSSPVGSYPITCSGQTSTNYTVSYVAGTLSVTARPVTVTADAKTKVYGAADPTLTYQITSGSLAGGDSVAGALTRAAGESVSSYAIQQGTLALSANYNLTYVGANLTITTRPITVTADGKTKMYGNADPALTYQITTGSLAFSDTLSGALARTVGENVGPYAINQGALSAGSNYNLTFVGATLTISPAPLTINPGNAGRVYGDANPSFPFTYSALVNGDTGIATPPACSTSTPLNSGIGAYQTITCSGAASPNYSPISYGPNGTLTITARNITATADAKSKAYGDSDPALTYQVTTGSLVFSDAFSGSLTRSAGENVGPHAIQQGTLSAGINYNLSFVGANLTITTRAITVTADAKTKVYGTADPALTYQLTTGSLAYSDTLSGALTRAAGENVGPYAILQGTLAAGSNYNLTFVGANLAITPAPLTINPANAGRVYGDPNPAFTFTFSGLVNGDLTIATTPTCSTSTPLNTGIGAYQTITCSGAASPNYSPIGYGAAGTLTITARGITVTADAKTKAYGDADPPLTHQITSGSLAFTDALAGALTRVPGETPGLHAIQQGTLSAGANYNLSFVGANLTITLRPITVTADAKTKVYGTTDPPFTYQLTSGSLAYSDTLSGALARSPGENVGPYAILQGSLTAGSNYNLTFVGANLSITPAPLTINPANANRVYGDPNPAFTFTYSGLVNGDATIATPPVCSTATPLNTGIGSYQTITCSGAVSSNYSPITYGPASTLTIATRGITVTPDAKTKVYGTADPALTYQITNGSLVFSDGLGGLLTRVAGESIGPYAIQQGTLSAGSNYALTYVGAVLTITKASASVTPNPAGKYWGQSDPVLTGTTSGFLASDYVTATFTRAVGETVGLYTISASLSPTGVLGNYNITYNTATFAINKHDTQIQYTGPTAAQSYDCISVSGILVDKLTNTPIGSEPIFLNIGALAGIAVNTAANGIGTGKLACNLDSGNYSALASFAGNSNYNASSHNTVQVVVSPRPVFPNNGAAVYTGSLYFWTTSASSNTATVALSATIRDLSEDCVGDISKAKVTFGTINGVTFTPIPGATNLPVGLVTPGNFTIGTATAIVQYDIGNSTSQSVTIGVWVSGGRYLRQSADDNQIITIAKPGVGNTINLGGVLSNAASAGYLAGATGSANANDNIAAVSGNVTYNKSGTNPQGGVTIYLHSYNKPDGTKDTVVHTYLVKSNSIATLSFPDKTRAAFDAKASIQDITTGTSVSVDGGATLQITVTTDDPKTTVRTMAVSVLNKNGGVWFANNWNGVRSVEATLFGSTALTNPPLGTIRIQ